MSTDSELESFTQAVKNTVDNNLADLIPAQSNAGRLTEAMRYAVLGGGKRIRPLLCFSSAAIFSNQTLGHSGVLAAASAVELIHAYSLVHDDLPAMDDDDLRRGRPTVHIQYDQATALLAGDALQTLAFEVLASASELSDSSRAKCISHLARGAGSCGMAGRAND